MFAVTPLLLVLVSLGIATGVLLAGGLQKIVNSRQDCPICWQSIPARVERCPKCNSKL